MNSLMEDIGHSIGEYGQKLIGVLDEDLPFMYTVGNHQNGLPELIIMGTISTQIGYLMNVLGRKMREKGRPFEDQELVDLGGRYPVKIVNGNGFAKAYTLQVENYYCTDEYQVQQVLICDQKGRFPDDPHCELPYSLQPILV